MTTQTPAQGSSRKHLLFVLPWVVGHCGPEERAALLADAPAPLKVLLRVGEGSWQRRRAVVLGRRRALSRQSAGGGDPLGVAGPLGHTDGGRDPV
jgi:hypothetical protein